MCSRNQLKDISKKMVAIYRNIYGESVTGIFLYGSYARGDNKEDSDIDIVGIVKGDRVFLQDKLKIIWDLSVDVSLENDTVVSPMVIPYDEFEEYKEILPYYRNIMKEGLRIG